MREGKRKLYTKKRENSKETARGAAKEAHKTKAEYTARYVVQRSDTLLEFLLKKCNQSRNNVKSLLSGGKVLVNGRAEKQFDFPLAKDDEIRISKTRAAKVAGISRNDEAREKGRERGKNGAAERAARLPLPKIIFEDERFLVLDKPAGLLSVESDDERLSAYYIAEEYLRQKGKKERAYVLHRIDKETSGVLAFAKDIKLHSMLRMHWNELVEQREYYAVVSGVFEEKSGEIVSYLKEDKNHLVYCVFPREGKRAVTRYETVKENGKFSLLRVEIDSGRKNQIRVAMKAAGHPVVGDEKYGGADTAFNLPQNSPLKRLGLHASRLALRLPASGESISFVSPVPKEFFAVAGKP